jgi:hypothetical protein
MAPQSAAIIDFLQRALAAGPARPAADFAG